MVKVLQLSCLLSKLLAPPKGHEVGLPNQNVGLRFARITELCLDLLLDVSAILDVDQNKSLGIAVCKELSSPRPECPICPSDEYSPAFVRFSAYGRFAVTLFVKALPREIFREEQRNSIRQANNKDGDDASNIQA